MARLGRPDILWSVNKLARSVTKWTQACDRRLARLISYIHHTSDHRQYCHVGNTAQHCRMCLFQDSDFAGDLEDSKSNSRGILKASEVEHSSPFVGCARSKRQYPTVLTESAIISLNAGLRTHGLPAHDLGDVVREVSRSSESAESPTHEGAGNCSQNRKSKPKQKGNRDVHQLSHVDYVTTNTHSSQGEPQLYISENNETAIKMIIKDRSPTVSHV